MSTFIRKTRSKSQLERYVRNYDIAQIKYHRMLNSFAIGRKLNSRENSDLKINTDIENSICGIQSLHSEPKNIGSRASITSLPRTEKIFTSLSFKGRNYNFYSKFARESLEKDIDKIPKKAPVKPKRNLK